MKNPIKLLFVLTLIASVFTLDSCKKKDRKDEPCNATTDVIATENNMHYLGHFILDDMNGNQFTVGQTFLFANNWSSYASQVRPGQKYKIAYREVPCKNRNCRTKEYEEYSNRCGMATLKCIEILCLKPYPAPKCHGLQFDSQEENYYSRAISGSKIENHSLKTLAYFSGCSANDPAEFTLSLKELPIMGPKNQPIFEARVIESNRMTCQALFQKNVCFDLSGLASRYRKNNIALPSEIIIRLYEGYEARDLYYYPHL